MTSDTTRRKGGKMVHLQADVLERVQTYLDRFQAENPGIEVTINSILANLVHHGLDAVERGPFVRMMPVRPGERLIYDQLIPFRPADQADELLEPPAELAEEVTP